MAEDGLIRTIGILLFDGVEELDAVGPYEVLAAWTRIRPDDGWRTLTVGVDGDGPVRGAKGLLMTPDVALSAAGAIDLLVHPGGQGTVRLMGDPGHLEWLRGQAAADLLTTSVCTGSLVLASAGLLRDRPATTHLASLETLASIDPTIEVRPDERYVDDGDIVTSSGVSAGIDMALHLVARLAGEERAREVRRYIQYDPAPPV
ncbi:MAG TPA: DJ-1/PfpI family protein [Acidimicrobiales bacterium]|nr:DJ-1/PfpI family protein [Acidimicrobiales bacterium]